MQEEIQIGRHHFGEDEILVPEGEPFDSFLARDDGSRRLWPKGRFIVRQGGMDITTRFGRNLYNVHVPEGTYFMVKRGSVEELTRIRRIDA